MAITKEIVVDKIEVLEMGQLQVRTATKVMEDGTELTRTYHRHVLEPSNKASGSWADTDISGEDTRVQAIANATWTNAVKKAYQDMRDAEGS
jgi:hypothetical protein